MTTDKHPISEQWALENMARARAQQEDAEGHEILSRLVQQFYREVGQLEIATLTPEAQWDNTGLEVSYNPCSRYWTCDECGKEHAPGLMRVVFSRNEHGHLVVSKQTCIVVCNPF